MEFYRISGQTLAMYFLLFMPLLFSPAFSARLPYVIGGHDVTDGTKWPWQGSLESFWSHSCGCSLISSTWAVTAAHCLGTSIELLQVRFGSITREKGSQERTLKEAIKHEDYGSGSGDFPNDIAVIHFDAVTLSDTVKPITMTTSEQAGNPDCFITGWGYTEEGVQDKVLPETLQQARVNVYTQQFCRQKWGSSSINDGHVCIGDAVNGRGSCSGDSGGPLVCAVGSTWELVGATSWSKRGCFTSYPAVYSRVTFFKDWITEKSGISYA